MDKLKLKAERLRIVADKIECTGTLDMSTTWHDACDINRYFAQGLEDVSCGTPGCIAGYAALESVRTPDGNLPDAVDPTIDVAAAWLMLTDREARDLFTPEIYRHDAEQPLSIHPRCTPDLAFWNAKPDDPAYITPAMAVATLRRFAETGEVLWQPIDRSYAK